jgi:squamous cell carcinoma antigen recognized by T-cells 3
LQAKISDPSKKADRHGAMYEGREVFIRNLHFGASEPDVRELFSRYGTIEKVRIPTRVDGKSKGVGFVAFENKVYLISVLPFCYIHANVAQESAENAVKALDNTSFKSRTVAVEISVPKTKRTETTIVRGSTASATPEPDSRPDASTSVNGDTTGTDGRTYKQRTLAILDLADTVNVARLEKLIEPYGEFKKISLRPDHGGAFIEFTDISSVGKASLGLEGKDLDGKTISVGTVEELLRQEPVQKAGKIAERVKAEASTQSTNKAKGFGPGAGLVSRPGSGTRGKGRGLGRKTVLGFSAQKSEADDPKSNSVGKSNAEFREMFLKGKETNGTKPVLDGHKH